MEVQQDFADLFKSFNTAKIEYLIVGGYVLAFHGAPRYTGDLNLFVKPDDENARRIVTALEAFGFGSLGLQPEDFTQPGNVVQLGYPPVRIDLITSLSGASWDEAWAHRETGSYGRCRSRLSGAGNTS